METSLRPLTSDNLTQASDALASAFFDDPLLRHLILEEAMRRRTLPAVMRANLRLTLPERESHVLVDESGRVLGAIGAMPPGKYPYPILRLIRYNLELFLRPTPWEPPLLQFMKGMAYQKQWDRLHCKEPHWYIYIIGVHADHHGKGHGKKLMEAILVKARASGHPVYLETQTEGNVPFYRAFGFDVTEKVEMAGGGPPIWGLLKKANS